MHTVSNHLWEGTPANHQFMKYSTDPMIMKEINLIHDLERFDCDRLIFGTCFKFCSHNKRTYTYCISSNTVLTDQVKLYICLFYTFYIVNDSVSVLTIYVDEKKKSRECDAEHKFCLEILKISKLEILDVQLAMMKSNIFKEILVLSSCKILCKQGEYLSPFIFRIKESVHSKSNKYQINSTHTAYFRPPCPTFQKINSRKTIICDQPIKL